MKKLEHLNSIIKDWYCLELLRAIKYGEVETARWLAEEIKKIKLCNENKS
jgi:hypothetical protein